MTDVTLTKDERLLVMSAIINAPYRGDEQAYAIVAGIVAARVALAKEQAEAERDEARVARVAEREHYKNVLDSAQADRDALAERLARVEALLVGGSIGYWSDGSGGWVRGVAADAISAALAPQEARDEPTR